MKKCKQCGSDIIHRVGVLRDDWAVGLHECFECGHKAHLQEFLALPFPVAPVSNQIGHGDDGGRRC